MRKWIMLCLLVAAAAELAMGAGFLPPLRRGAGSAVCMVLLVAMGIAAVLILPNKKRET